MKIKVPKFIYKDSEQYKLYVQYTPLGTQWDWTIAYVGSKGILFNRAHMNLGELERQVFEFIRENGFDYE